MLEWFRNLFRQREPVGYDPAAIKEMRRAMRECARYERENRQAVTGLTWYENKLVEMALADVVAKVSRKYIAEGGDIKALRKEARDEVGKILRRDHGDEPVTKAFNRYVDAMPVIMLLNAEALQKLHDRTEETRDFVTRFGADGYRLLDEFKAGRISDPRLEPFRKRVPPGDRV